MFPSSGLFADINCPFSKRGLCERPHCLYKHATELRDGFGSSDKSSILDFAGVKNGYVYADCGAPVNDVTKDDCIQELERINKEIETVRHEVEQEQRRLSHYQTVQADSRNTVPNSAVSKSETAGKNVDRGFYGRSSCTNLTKKYSRAKKYVVDNSKPRTDLEYDPLSNFSADLRSYSSSGKEQKVRKGQSLKRSRNALPCDEKKPVADQAQLSRSPSPDDSNEDSVLIIDIPPSPDKQRGRDQTSVDSVAGKSLQEKVEELKEIKTAAILLNSPPLPNTEACKVTSPPAPTVEKNIVNSKSGAENNQGPSYLYENKEFVNIPVDGSVVDLTGCLEDGGRESQTITHFQATETVVEKSPEPASHPANTDQQDWNNLVVKEEENTFRIELPQCEKMEPYNFPQRNSLFYEAPAAISDPSCMQYTKKAQTIEQPAQNRVTNQWCSTKCVPSVLPHQQKTSSKMPGPTQGKAAVNHAQPESCLEPAKLASRDSQGPARHNSSASSLTNIAESSSASTEQLLEKADSEGFIIIESSSDDEDELNYSEMELSDSDPMEECYRIFMEANEDKGNEEQPDEFVEAMDVEKQEFNAKLQALPGKKRVAHEAKHTEQPVAKRRTQPQVLVPLRGPAVSGIASQPSTTTTKIQQVQQRAPMLTASFRGGQTFVSSAFQGRPENQSTPTPSALTPENLQLATVQNAYINYIPLGTAVIEVGNNLHLILPEGAFPLPGTSTSSQVTSVLTPMSQVNTSTVAVKQIYHPPAVTSVQRYRTTAPVLIPAPARKPSLTSSFASAYSSPATSTTPQAAVHATVKPVPTKRKLKQQCEAPKDKVPHDLRQRYVNMFTEEFLKTTTNVNDAFEKALAEERTVYNRSVNKLKYQSVAVNALKRLKNQSAVAAKDEKVISQRLKGNIPLNLKKFKGNDDMALYDSLKDYILTEERLIESNYPVQHPEKPGCAILFADNKKGNTDSLKRICCRCGATFSVSQTGKHIRKEECNYHYGKGVKNKVPGGVETRYSCCEGVMGAPGCQVFKLHVHDSLSLDGFVSTLPRHPGPDTGCPGVYSLDCEMCYTIHGLELSRVTLVNSGLQVVYDTFVRPDNEVIDYNTRFSGISEEDVKGNHTSLREVQETLLSFISADTILIGHSLETDLCALKLLHGTVVDTSVVFPHRLGLPHKLTLNNLTAEYLRRIIQESVCGHDTAEDAAACMELMLWKVKEDGKLKK
ncbi:RNA exonuclease 1 homolog isoform X2 [Dicentrarchus labrax]|uniref:Exonuclease domain-containing protein n=1 Tax=Dicentrarchus labrax TaxID=13489 RepID=A0A8P4K8T6_DICLA|nr:RNA exonuclease 1 homolog isoform X2 [Dicentrarchus labrax]